MSHARTRYTGPLKNRGVDDQGRAKVSREELADFKAQYGQDKTLRDLLNADRTGRLPAPAEPVEKRYPPKRERSEDNRLARGPQGLNEFPKGVSRDMASAPSGGGEDDDRRASQAAAPERSRASLAEIPGLLYRGMLEGAERVPAGRGMGAALMGGMTGATRGASATAAATRGAMSKEAAKKTATSRRSEPILDLADEAAKRGPAKPGRSEPFMRGDDGLGLADDIPPFKKGGVVKPRGSGCARKGFGKGRMV